MRMKIPITGKVKSITPNKSGDLDDPIRMININLGDIGWRLTNLDIENEEMEIELIPPARMSQPEANAAIEHARQYSLEKMSKQALYALSKSPRLINPFKEEPA